MTIENDDQLQKLKQIGAIVGDTLRLLGRHVTAGITTQELDDIASRELARLGARSAPRLVYDFPGTTCISINNEAAHGVPSNRVLQEGDVVNIDVSAEKDGYFADTGRSFAVGVIDTRARRLLETGQTALRKACFKARSKQKLRVIGKTVENCVTDAGFSVIRDLSGHGVGRSIHEEPSVLNYDHPSGNMRLRKGDVIAIEPVISTGPGFIDTAADGLTYVVPEGHICAQFEHTIVITDRAPIILT